MKRDTQSNPERGAPVDSDDLRVTESVHGIWHYHLSSPGRFVSLCGVRVMNTAIPVKNWGQSGNPELHEHWCSTCEKMSGIKTGSEPRE